MSRPTDTLLAQSRDHDAEEALLRADHPDPFGFLGMHRTEDGVVIRSFQPQAARVWLIESETGRELGELQRVRDEGLFMAYLDRPQPFRYRLRLDCDGHLQEVEDPYRFWPVLGEMDIHLMAEGMHKQLYERLGAHCMTLDGVEGVYFAVWAPNAKRVSVVGDFNSWDGRRHPMRLHGGAGVWELFIPGIGHGAIYKYEIKSRSGETLPLKADPMGFWAEVPPATASRVYDLKSYDWKDKGWMEWRQNANARNAPISIYEVHLESWRRKEDNQPLTYRELAEQLGDYVMEMGFTHVELLPVHEHPFSGSWGYQPIGLYAPSSRFGTPDDFRFMVEHLHERGIGVIIDWVAGHFPTDSHGLAQFDGTHLYEHADPRQGMHKDWNTLIFNYGRNEVKNYLYSNALYWLHHYHVDGLRVDAVASMLYLDYSRQPDEWIPNKFGGNENLEAIDFLRHMNEVVYGDYPGSMTIAEESTAWPMVSRPVYLGGLGFGYKWNMGWMHDTLRYIGKDPIHRRYHHDDLTFGLLYAFQENFVLPLSHDEVVHGKGSILGRMPGDEWQRFANLRAYYGFMWTHPGKKLLFMGSEFGQVREWNHDGALDWHLLDYDFHKGAQRLVRDLNRLYRETPALHQMDCEPQGFAWIDANDRDNSVLSYMRKGANPDDLVVVVCNFTPQVLHNYRIGMPFGGAWGERLNTDSTDYGGSGVSNGGELMAEEVPWHGQPVSLSLTLPPLATLVLQPLHR
ncbi:1,4-alpha-glucan branching protein GlgB [Telmatospirillum sp. J64-1]|uniref:1,4-alpha-glucan branching protein GlgB n=1 Tax=Telmatospirillum sp. J64-1 TaxID=2502183 RepID=UPI00115CF7DD|nr:1,4-alpha-glucan branching protein GlgB [Telmatospirillum sp. J64-1]